MNANWWYLQQISAYFYFKAGPQSLSQYLLLKTCLRWQDHSWGQKKNHCSCQPRDFFELHIKPHKQWHGTWGAIRE